MPMTYKFFDAHVGFREPQLLIQLHLLQWGIGGGVGKRSVSARLGPVSIRLYFRTDFFEKIAVSDGNWE